jgi:thiamine-phosphate pyrophosphorylase
MGRPDRLSRLIVIGNGFASPRAKQVLIELAATGKLEWLHLRDHDASFAQFRSAAESLHAHVRKVSPATTISINTRIDLALELKAGLHLGFRGLEPELARGRLGADALLGYSIHQPDEITDRLSETVDYFLLGPVFDSISKPDSRGVGLRVVERVVARTSKPVFAVGGVTPQNAGSCLRSGAYGIASIGGIMHAPDASASLNEYLEAIADPPA